MYMCGWYISNAKSESVKIDQKPETTSTDPRRQPLPNHRRQVLEPKAVTAFENKVNLLTAVLNITLLLIC